MKWRLLVDLAGPDTRHLEARYLEILGLTDR